MKIVFNNDSYFNSSIIIYEEESDENIILNNMESLSNIITIESNYFIDNNYPILKFDLNMIEEDILINLDHIKIAKINSDKSVEIVNSNRENNFLIAPISEFGKYFLINTGDNQSFNIPEEFGIISTYPNPFNPITKIEYVINYDDCISINVYNILGENIKELKNVYQSSGAYSVTWDGTNFSGIIMPTGVYFIELKGSNFTDVHKVLLLK